MKFNAYTEAMRLLQLIVLNPKFEVRIQYRTESQAKAVTTILVSELKKLNLGAEVSCTS